ncbi:MAG: DUF4397 domain-containing protein, partial [Halalkalicoccus sp.]|nr:DUF4397 domain-containing protein [Halalkalicoccus sp.]
MGQESESEDNASTEDEQQGGSGSGNDSAEGETDSEEEGGQGGEMAMVRVAHLSPDAPNVDVYVDDQAVLEDVPYRTV